MAGTRPPYSDCEGGYCPPAITSTFVQKSEAKQEPKKQTPASPAAPLTSTSSTIFQTSTGVKPVVARPTKEYQVKEADLAELFDLAKGIEDKLKSGSIYANREIGALNQQIFQTLAAMGYGPSKLKVDKEWDDRFKANEELCREYYFQF